MKHIDVLFDKDCLWDFPMQRRIFLTLTGLAVSFPLLSAQRSPVQPEEIPANPFTLGVASGDPGGASISLWTRMAPRPLNDGGMPMRPAQVIWQCSDSENFSRIVQYGTEIAWPEYGHVIKPRVSGLRPGTQYFYRFRFGRFESRVGRFRTAPANSDNRPIRIGVVSCNRYEDGWFHAFRHLIQDDVDFILHVGDYIYEKAARHDRVRKHIGGECYTLEDYRRRYAQYRLDSDLQDLHAATPFVSTWDDHEVSGNWAGLNDRFGTPEEVFSVRHAAALQAYWEAMPFNVPKHLPGDELLLYRHIRYGANIDLIMLDSRQYRSDQACNDGPPKPICEEARDPSRTMLGEAQSHWLREMLDKTSDRWPIIGRQVPSFEMNYSPDQQAAVSMDKWDGYPLAQEAFNRTLAAADRPPLTLAGDAHAHFAAQRRKVDNNKEFGADIVCTSVSSGGDGQDTDDRWPILKANNPDIQYHSKRRGYVLVNVSESDIAADFRTIDKISTIDHRLHSSARIHLDSRGILTTEQSQILIRDKSAS